MLLARRAFGYPLTFSKSMGGPPSRRFWTAASSRWGSISAFEVSSSPASFRYSSVERRLEMSFLLIAGMGLAIVVLLGGSGRGGHRPRPRVSRRQEPPQTVLNVGDVFEHHARRLIVIATGEGRADLLMGGQIAPIGRRVHLEPGHDFLHHRVRHRVGEEHQERVLRGFREHPV